MMYQLTNEQADELRIHMMHDGVPLGKLASEWLSANLPAPEEYGKLRKALLIAANRIQRLQLECEPDSGIRQDAGDWVNEARVAATSKSAADTKLTPRILLAHGVEWWAHDGSDECPCDRGLYINVLIRDGMTNPHGSQAYCWRWRHTGGSDDIIGWRIADTDESLPDKPKSSSRGLHRRAQKAESEILKLKKEICELKGNDRFGSMVHVCQAVAPGKMSQEGEHHE